MRRMILKGGRATRSHYMFPTYEGAPFYEAICGTERLAEDWEDCPDDDKYPLHTSCARVARVHAEELAQQNAA